MVVSEAQQQGSSQVGKSYPTLLLPSKRRLWLALWNIGEVQPAPPGRPLPVLIPAAPFPGMCQYQSSWNATHSHHHGDAFAAPCSAGND
jgi:hypothetical protein